MSLGLWNALISRFYQGSSRRSLSYVLSSDLALGICKALCHRQSSHFWFTGSVFHRSVFFLGARHQWFGFRVCLLAVALIVLPWALVVHQHLATLLKQAKHFFGRPFSSVYFLNLFSQIKLFVFFESPGNCDDRSDFESRYRAKVL